MNNLGRGKAELLEALIISSKQNTNLINKNFELRNLQQLDIETEQFNERVDLIYLIFNFYKPSKIKVKRFHTMTAQLLSNKWNELAWENFNVKPATDTPEVKF